MHRPMPNYCITPSLEEFQTLASRGNLIPLVASFVADVETPISAFAKLRGKGPCFLFESAEKTEGSGRFSFIGADPLIIIQGSGHTIRVEENGGSTEFATDTDPLVE